MHEWVTVISALILTGVSLYGYFTQKSIEYLSWTISGLAFLVISLALASMGLDALALSITPYLGSIYPSFMALGVIAIKYKEWRYYLAFIFLMLILIAIGNIQASMLKTMSQVSLHTISGLIIIVLPVIYTIKKYVPAGFLILALGGITIGIGGMALASIAAGKPILPLELVIRLLHPILYTSAFLLALGIYLYLRG